MNKLLDAKKLRFKLVSFKYHDRISDSDTALKISLGKLCIPILKFKKKSEKNNILFYFSSSHEKTFKTVAEGSRFLSFFVIHKTPSFSTFSSIRWQNEIKLMC